MSYTNLPLSRLIELFFKDNNGEIGLLINNFLTPLLPVFGEGDQSEISYPLTCSVPVDDQWNVKTLLEKVMFPLLDISREHYTLAVGEGQNNGDTSQLMLTLEGNPQFSKLFKEGYLKINSFLTDDPREPLIFIPDPSGVASDETFKFNITYVFKYFLQIDKVREFLDVLGKSLPDEGDSIKFNLEFPHEIISELQMCALTYVAKEFLAKLYKIDFGLEVGRSELKVKIEPYH